MEYPKHLLGQFKNDYQCNGKYNLELQVPHLVKLAGFYERRYKLTKDWTDIVKAHALYNSINVRQPQSLWEQRAYGVQQDYLAERSSFSQDQQQALNSSLKHEIESIRDQCRKDMLAADELASSFDCADTIFKLNERFFECMQHISLNCSNRMTEFAGRIVRESVSMINPIKPPCDFVAVAIGSLARGEATPYSDLEFFFLIEHRSPDIIKYFENLAITIYFQIGNLGETKLKYMSIKELNGWFDDQAKNGFKIDGLTDQAGNIPTGNGSSQLQNHFILTPDELAHRYVKVLTTPDKEEALRGDLTAMLKYMKPLYTYDCGNKDLFKELQNLIQNCPMNSLRCEVNHEMLQTDVRKFSFRPSDELLHKGLNADVKREVYRFPSILLLDIIIVAQMYGESSWQSIRILHHRKQISAQLQFILKLLLASATYMRLSAYLYHDSQDDRMSISQQKTVKKLRPESTYFSSQNRWFVPIGLFVAMCTKLILLKRKLAKSTKIVAELETLNLGDDDDTWCYTTTLYFTNRYTEALASLKKIYGDNLCDDPLSVAQNIPPGEDVYDTLDIISQTLYMCGEYKASIALNEYIMSNCVIDRRNMIANCYSGLGNHPKAVDILESIASKSGHTHYILGEVYSKTKEYAKSEKSFLLSLGEECSSMSPEQLYDYYGDPIATDVLTEILNASWSPEAMLPKITYISHNVIMCIAGLGEVYSHQGHYALSNKYYQKALHQISELYGDGAAVPLAAELHRLQGGNFSKLNEYENRLDQLKQALSVYRVLPFGTSDVCFASTIAHIGSCLCYMGLQSQAMDHYKENTALLQQLLKETTNISDQGHIMNHLGIVLLAIGQNSEAEMHLRHSLAIQSKPSQDNNYANITFHTLHWLGQSYVNLGRYKDAETHCKQALAMYRQCLQDNHTSSGVIGKTLHNLADSYKAMFLNIEAEYFYEQANELYRQLHQGASNKSIALTLLRLGETYTKVNHAKAIGTLREAVHMYIRVDPQNTNIKVIWDILSDQLNHHHRV